MSPQADYVVSNGTGAAVRSDINGQLAAIVSNNSGASAPATTYAYQFWADTSTSLLKVRNGANSAWITVGDLTAANLGLATLASPTFTGTATIPTLTVSTAANIPLGSAASPTLYFTGDSNTGLYSPGADQLALSTGGTGRLFINSSGSVGVGTSGPAQLLHLKSTGDTKLLLNSTNNASDRGIYFATSTDSEILGYIKQEYSTGKFEISSGSGSYGSGISFRTGGTADRVVIDSSGRLGVGTTSPTATLEVKGGQIVLNTTSANSSAIIYRINDVTKGYIGPAGILGGSDNDMGYRVESGNNQVFYIGASERARLDSSGRLLVGTSTTRGNGSLLQVVDDSSNNPAQFFCSPNNAEGPNVFLLKARGGSTGSPAVVSSGDTLGRLRFSGYDGSTYQEAASIVALVDATPGANDMPGRLVFSTTADGASSPTERMRISNNGTVYIGPGSGSTLNSAAFVPDGSLSPYLAFDTNYGGGTKTNVEFRRNGTIAGSITSTSTTTAYNTSSDYRLKENIELVTDATDRIKALKPCRFNFIADPEKTVDGFIAHEAQEVVPEAITGEKDAVDADGNPIYQGIDQSKLVPLLTAALQEAVAKIESLEARLTAAGI